MSKVSSPKEPVRMKLIDALTNVERTKDNSSHICLYALLQSFNINNWSDYNDKKFENRVKGYYVYSHYCTDTVVGLEAIFMDNKLIGMCLQHHRKFDPKYSFISKEDMKRLRDFVYECIEEVKEEFPILTKEELNEIITMKNWC